MIGVESVGLGAGLVACLTSNHYYPNQTVGRP